MIDNIKYDVFYKVLYKVHNEDYTGHAIFRKNKGWEVITPTHLCGYNTTKGYLLSSVKVIPIEEVNSESRGPK